MSGKKTKINKPQQDFQLKSIIPLTATQEIVFESYEDGKNLLLHGYAGTGKTYISLYLALKEILTGSRIYDNIVIIRSAVQSRDIGFLPGDEETKAKVYETPYKEMCDNLFGRGDGYQILKMKELVKFTTTSFLRGITFNNSIVIVDEIQNLSWQELDTVMTRLGDQAKIIFCGDYLQTDLVKVSEKQGLKKFQNLVQKLDNFSYIEFNIDDIVRSGIVKDYIIKRTEMGY